MKIEPVVPGRRPPIDFAAFLDVDPGAGRVRVRREALTDPAIFELEMRHIFEGGWIYLAHESQLRNRFDFYTAWMGRQPVIVYRNGEGAVEVFLSDSTKALSSDTLGREYEGLIPSQCSIANTVVALSVLPLSPCSTGFSGRAWRPSANAVRLSRLTACSASSAA